VLRGAGFPARLLLELSNPECGRAADRFTAAEALLDQRYEAAVGTLTQALDALRLRGSSEKDDPKFKTLVSTLRQVRSRKIRVSHPDLTEFRNQACAIEAALVEHKLAWTNFQAAFCEATESQSRKLQRLAADSRLQEAVIWQNRQAFESGVRQVVECALRTGLRNKKQRQHEELVANYLQRYCAKNDTIGFFGPVAWGEIESGGPPIDIRPGTSLLRARRTYFESWAIDALADRFSATPGLEWRIAPRIVPYCHLEGDKLYAPAGKPVQLNRLSRAILSHCDGQTRAIEIVQALQRDPSFSGTTKEQVGRILHSFVTQGLLMWRIIVPVEVDSEINLRHQLYDMGAPELTAQATFDLNQLDDLRQKVAAVAGDPLRLNAALNELQSTFERIAQTPGQKAAGVTYGARTLVYEDCQRDLGLRISPDFFGPILPALTLLLRSLRWLVLSTGQAFYDVLRETYRALALTQTLDQPEVSAIALWMAMRHKVKERPPDSVIQIERLFKKKWTDILQLGDAHASIHRQSRVLAQDVERAFPEVVSDLNAGYYCPDIMVATADPEALRSGSSLYVLGELHLGLNTLTSALFVAQHPDPQDLVGAVEWDNRGGVLQVLSSPRWERVTTRTNEGVFSRQDFLLSSAFDSLPPSGYSAHPIGNMVVRMLGGRLVVMSRDQRYRFEILDAFSPLVHLYVMNQARWFETVPHIPRVTIDSLVIQRESWSVSVEELRFAEEKEEERRFAGARKWRADLNLPAVVFIKSPVEMKPFYVDFDTPIYVEVLCKMVRRLKSARGTGAEISISEMLPHFSDLWLPDDAGERYTSEFRLALVDLKTRAYLEKRTGKKAPVM
jgi:hypothetical protein